MTDPVWPSGTSGQRILENSRTDRDDGYDFVTIVGVQADNGVEVRWRTDGEVHTFPGGERHRFVHSIENVPPHMKSSDTPSVTTRTLRENVMNGKRRVEVEDEIEFADGQIMREKYEIAIDRPLAELTSVDHEITTEALKEIHEQGLPPRDDIKPGRMVLNSRGKAD